MVGVAAAAVVAATAVVAAAGGTNRRSGIGRARFQPSHGACLSPAAASPYRSRFAGSRLAARIHWFPGSRLGTHASEASTSRADPVCQLPEPAHAAETTLRADQRPA